MVVFQKEELLSGTAIRGTSLSSTGTSLRAGAHSRDKASGPVFEMPGMCVRSEIAYSSIARSKLSSMVMRLIAGEAEANLRMALKAPRLSDFTLTVIGPPWLAQIRKPTRSADASQIVVWSDRPRLA